jgi:hypothetical protein
MTRGILGTRAFQGDDGRYGLEAFGEDSTISSALDPEHLFESEAVVSGTMFSRRLLEPRYDSIEELRQTPWDSSTFYYRLVSNGKVGLHITRFETWTDDVRSYTILDPVHDSLVKVGALIFTRGRKYQVFKYEYLQNPVAPMLICAAGSWDKFVRKLRQKMPNVTDDDLTQAHEGLMGQGDASRRAREP